MKLHCTGCKAPKFAGLFSPAQRAAKGYRLCLSCARKQRIASRGKSYVPKGIGWRTTAKLYKLSGL
jgi:hypothetical protein